MKRRDLEEALKNAGWYLDRHGGSHDIWTNGSQIQPVPRHNEIPEGLAKKIVRFAEQNPGQKRR